MTACNMQLLIDRPQTRAKVSVILLDWGVRESFHSIRYLNQQTVPREDYELIWIEFYDRRPAAMQRLLDEDPTCTLDAWLVMGYDGDTHYHKHRMYNAGIVLSHGQICVICDSDAVFLPTFIESIIKAFEARPNAAIHLDEVRNYSKKYYPFNYPSLEEILDEGCVNWTGTTTTGLDNHPDMYHSANYGACMAAWRRDLIAIGGADEHIDYLGYICGPYELTFRLVNMGREEHWLCHEYIYHMWHPNTSGCNIEHKGPDDGRGMSLPAMECLTSGRVEPLKENCVIRRLREGATDDRVTLLRQLSAEDDDAWQVQHDQDDAATAGPPLVYGGYNLTCYRNTWYATPQKEGPFDPIKIQNQQYSLCLSALTAKELQAMLVAMDARRIGLWQALFVAVRRLPLPQASKRIARAMLGWRRGQMVQPSDYRAADDAPHLVEEGYRGFNIIYWRGEWYGLGQEEGAVVPAKLRDGKYRRLIKGETLDAVRAEVQQQQQLHSRAIRFARRCIGLARMSICP